MLEWIVRGLRRGRVTTRYPFRDEEPFLGFRGRVDVLVDDDAEAGVAAVCPTGAIAVDARGRVSVDRGRCILCGACVDVAPERFTFRSAYETAARRRSGLVVGAMDGVDSEEIRAALGDQRAALRRSVHVRHVDAGSDGAEEWEIQALTNPYYDVQRLGIFFTAAPRHADILLVTGGVTEPMREPLLRTWEAMPGPKALVAVGTDACSGGLSEGGGVDRLLRVDVYVPGSPPSPIAILHGLLLAMGVLREEAPR
jgi:Ni,Fe-hydrogenase III small subunit/ferredoxin